MPGTFLGIGKSRVTKTKPLPREACILLRERDDEHMNKYIYRVSGGKKFYDGK